MLTSASAFLNSVTRVIMQPTALRAHRDSREFEVTWPDGLSVRLPFRRVRGECPCATCIDEITGARLLDANTIPADIAPTELGYSGNYAVKITWSDGHNTGIYTWDRWRWLSETAEAK
jgi:DUF971 family protein